MGGVLSSAMGLVKVATGNAQRAEQITKATRTSPADVVSTNVLSDSKICFLNLMAYFFYL
jgi:metacaspase-1